MKGAIIWVPLCFVFFLQDNVDCSKTKRTVWFQPDSEYMYKYEGVTDIKDVAQIKVTAEVGIQCTLLWRYVVYSNTQFCR